MPIVPAFDPSTGASGGGGSGGGGTSTPVWLDVPTQVIQQASAATGSITLNTPTNGTAPFTYRVIAHGRNTNATLTVSGNVLELNGAAVPATANTEGNVTAYRVIVRDAVGNLGIGVLYVWTNTSAGYSYTIAEEKVLDWDEDIAGYNFAARTPSGSATAYRPTGDGFMYPRPVTAGDVEGARWASCPPGSFIVGAYQRSLGGGLFELVLLILRRKLNMAAIGQNWIESPDFIAWPDLSAFSPTVPLGTSSTAATVVETNSVNGKSYALDRWAYAVTAGAAPTAETASVSGGTATISTENTVGSTRLIDLSLRPAVQSTNSQREGTLFSSIASMVRVKCRATLTGDYAYAEIKFGLDYPGTNPVNFGVRLRGRQAVSFTIAGNPALQVSLNRGGALGTIGWVPRALFDGVDIGVDLITLGGVGFITVYPWDAGWTDFPDYADDGFTLPVDGALGPSPVVVNSTNLSTNLPYSIGLVPVSAFNNAQDNFTRNWGVHFAVAQGGTGSGGAQLDIYTVKYYWKALAGGSQT